MGDLGSQLEGMGASKCFKYGWRLRFVLDDQFGCYMEETHWNWVGTKS